MEMEVDENEDPEERRERERREQSSPRMRGVATRAGWISLGAFCSGFIFLVLAAIPGGPFSGSPIKKQLFLACITTPAVLGFLS